MSYAVIGGGISGLCAALYLRDLPHVRRIIVLESSNRFGGWIETTTNKDGIFYEHGPRTIRPMGPQGANTLRLVERLGLRDKVIPIPRTHPAAQNRFVLVNGQLHKLPSNFSSLFKPLEPFKRPLILSAFKDLFTKPRIADDDSIYNFVARRFGSHLADYAIDPMVRGICAGNAREISASAFVTGALYDYEQRYGGVLKGALKQSMSKSKDPNQTSDLCNLAKTAKEEKWSVWSLEGGLQTLVNRIHTDLSKDVRLLSNCQIKDIRTNEGQGNPITIQTQDDEFTVDHVLMSTPAFASAQLLAKNHPSIANVLQSIPYVTVAVVTIEFEGKVSDMDAFGFLVPSSQPEPILGVIFDTCSFPQDNRQIFTVMMGGRWFDDIFGNDPSEETLETVALNELRRIMQIRATPVRIAVKVQRNCIAQYTVGHKRRVQEVKSKAEPLGISLIGSAYDGVGVNDAIMSAKRAVDRIASENR